MTLAMSCPCEIRTSACRSFATISSGLCFFFGISVLLHVQRHSSGRTTSKGEDHDSGVSAATFSLGAGLFLIAVAMLSSTIGGFIAGRLRTKWVGVHTHEVYFRDTAHGFLAWAFATLLGVGILGAAVTHITAGASVGATQASVTTQAASGPMDGYVD